MLVLGGVTGGSDVRSVVGIEAAKCESIEMSSFLASKSGYLGDFSGDGRGAMGDCRGWMSCRTVSLTGLIRVLCPISDFGRGSLEDYSCCSDWPLLLYRKQPLSF